MSEAEAILKAIGSLAGKDEDPFVSPRVLAEAIQLGILDAPHLKGSQYAAGRLVTRIVGGAVDAIDPDTGEPISENDRLALLTASAPGSSLASEGPGSGAIRN
jgi:hypothetical protein